MVFQDPLSALTPVYTVGDQLAEAVRMHNDVSGQAAREREPSSCSTLVGIPHAAERASAFPHEFSGGMRQRVMIAMAIANDPDVIIADEPTTALDVTIQAQVLEVLRTARELTGAAIVMITHDLSVIAGFADRVAVMYAGRIVETGTVDEVFYSPRMPYTMGLLGAIPRADESGDRPLVPIEGTPPSLVDLPRGLPVRRALPARVRHLPRGRAGAHRGRQPEPSVRVPPRREDRGGRLGADRRLPAAGPARGRRRADPARGARGRPRGPRTSSATTRC